MKLLSNAIHSNNFRNYSAYPLFCPIAALKVLIYTYKLRAFALLLNKLEGNLSSNGLRWVVTDFQREN